MSRERIFYTTLQAPPPACWPLRVRHLWSCFSTSDEAQKNHGCWHRGSRPRTRRQR